MSPCSIHSETRANRRETATVDPTLAEAVYVAYARCQTLDAYSEPTHAIPLSFREECWNADPADESIKKQIANIYLFCRPAGLLHDTITGFGHVILGEVRFEEGREWRTPVKTRDVCYPRRWPIDLELEFFEVQISDEAGKLSIYRFWIDSREKRPFRRREEDDRNLADLKQPASGRVNARMQKKKNSKFPEFWLETWMERAYLATKDVGVEGFEEDGFQDSSQFGPRSWAGETKGPSPSLSAKFCRSSRPRGRHRNARPGSNDSSFAQSQGFQSVPPVALAEVKQA